MDKCWPFDPEEKNRSLPSMNVRKFRWWAQGLDRKGKQRSPKKRSITELFAMAPPISTVEARSEGPDEAHEQKLITPDQLSTETLTDDVEKKKPSKGKKRKRKIKALESKSDEETIKERKKKEKKKKKKLKEKKLKKKKLEVQIQCEPKVHNSIITSLSIQILFYWIKLRLSWAALSVPLLLLLLLYAYYCCSQLILLSISPNSYCFYLTNIGGLNN